MREDSIAKTVWQNTLITMHVHCKRSTSRHDFIIKITFPMLIARCCLNFSRPVLGEVNDHQLPAPLPPQSFVTVAREVKERLINDVDRKTDARVNLQTQKSSSKSCSSCSKS
mmetsp:Transcript_19366/g.33571  ORF Transcript_19366/g.33571 Transcript_19366/m.33571 type:complete len:112 (+) Transcript_19366:298-633(+)